MTRLFSESDSGRKLGLITSPSHPCAYLPGRDAATAFVDPATMLTNHHYSRLAELGFRRSGSYIYRPACRNCDACIPIRIPVADFVRRRRERRICSRNRNVTVKSVPCTFRQDHFSLFQAYISARHSGGGMDNPDPAQYQSFLTNEWSSTRLHEFRDNDHLLAVAVTDQLVNGLSAVYTFFDPTEYRRSLGIYAILWQIQGSQRRQMDWLYLGYWIKECSKMSYKGEFRPLQVLRNGRWLAI